jgi:hypothetical protein
MTLIAGEGGTLQHRGPVGSVHPSRALQPSPFQLTKLIQFDHIVVQSVPVLTRRILIPGLTIVPFPALPDVMCMRIPVNPYTPTASSPLQIGPSQLNWSTSNEQLKRF